MFEIIVTMTANTFGVSETVAQLGVVLGGGTAVCAALAKVFGDMI